MSVNTIVGGMLLVAAVGLTTANVGVAYAQAVSMNPPGAPPFLLQLDPPQVGADPIAGAPFTADGVTVMIQVLEDGNRVERRYRSRIARDSEGRFRQQLEVASQAPPSFAAP